ncbi:MAG: hypothetical protein HYU64_07695 [Armatimonadetes bacterium]|nr:hypothetical protein [Armatimonadota bacterium]
MTGKHPPLTPPARGGEIKKWNRQRGATLLTIVVCAGLFISTLALGGLQLLSSDTQLSEKGRAFFAAYDAAEAGVRRYVTTIGQYVYGPYDLSGNDPDNPATLLKVASYQVTMTYDVQNNLYKLESEGRAPDWGSYTAERILTVTITPQTTCIVLGSAGEYIKEDIIPEFQEIRTDSLNEVTDLLDRAKQEGNQAARDALIDQAITLLNQMRSDLLAQQTQIQQLYDSMKSFLPSEVTFIQGKLDTLINALAAYPALSQQRQDVQWVKTQMTTIATGLQAPSPDWTQLDQQAKAAEDKMKQVKDALDAYPDLKSQASFIKDQIKGLRTGFQIMPLIESILAQISSEMTSVQSAIDRVTTLKTTKYDNQFKKTVDDIKKDLNDLKKDLGDTTGDLRNLAKKMSKMFKKVPGANCAFLSGVTYSVSSWQDSFVPYHTQP